MQTSAGVYYYQINEFDLNGNLTAKRLTTLTDASFDSDTSILGIEQSYSQQDSIFILGEKLNPLFKKNYGYLFKDNSNSNEFRDFKRDKYGSILVGGSYDPNGFGEHPFIARFLDTTSTLNILQIDGEESRFILFPNPAHNYLIINPIIAPRDISNYYSFKIYDVFGRIVFESNEEINQSYRIDLTGFAKGIYLLKFLSNSKNTLLKKIIIN